jgi:hypothetical protein
MVALALILGFGLGWGASRWREVLGRFKSKRLQATAPAMPQSRILRPFAPPTKRKPIVNSDEKAWARENAPQG